jgi:hypothetical protein
MADWKQITARIRRARTGKDPVGQLSNLFEKTHDAMVAFELARYFETSGQNPDAAKWYSTAAEKFRRADWKAKAQEAATRLAGLAPGELAIPASGAAAAVTAAEPALPFIQNAEIFETLAASESAVITSDSDSASEPESLSSVATNSADSLDTGPRGRRRRGRRGGRNRRKRGAAGDAAPAPVAPAHRSTSDSAGPRSISSSVHAEPPPARFDKIAEGSALRLPIEPADAGGIALRGRYGDPGLSSRLSLLEMQFRRLLTCTPVKLDDIAAAPAGPGVFLLSDSDLTSYYYVEACQTLRIAIPNLLRGGSTRRGVDSIKPQLADHLGIAETRVGKYLTDHCVVRWLQLDEGASHFAHFVIAVLRPVLNE